MIFPMLVYAPILKILDGALAKKFFLFLKHRQLLPELLLPVLCFFNNLDIP